MVKRKLETEHQHDSRWVYFEAQSIIGYRHLPMTDIANVRAMSVVIAKEHGVQEKMSVYILMRKI
jgi:hypothetical protein